MKLKMPRSLRNSFKISKKIINLCICLYCALKNLGLARAVKSSFKSLVNPSGRSFGIILLSFTQNGPGINQSRMKKFEQRRLEQN